MAEERRSVENQRAIALLQEAVSLLRTPQMEEKEIEEEEEECPQVVYYFTKETRISFEGESGEVKTVTAGAYGEWPDCFPKEWQRGLPADVSDGNVVARQTCDGGCGKHTLYQVVVPGGLGLGRRERIIMVTVTENG